MPSFDKIPGVGKGINFIKGAAMAPFHWIDTALTARERNLRIAVVSLGAIAIGVIVTLITLKTMGVINGTHFHPEHFALSMSGVMPLAIGGGLIGAGLGYWAHRSACHIKNPSVREGLELTLKCIAVAALIAATILLAVHTYTYRGGFINGLCSGEGMVTNIMITGVTGILLHALMQRKSTKPRPVALPSRQQPVASDFKTV